MGEKKGLSAEVIIAIIVAVIVVGVIIYFAVTAKPKEEVVYGLTEATTSSPNTLINDYKTYKRLVDKMGVNDEIKIDYKKNSMKQRYTEEFFQTKKLAVIVVAEDTSKDYFYDVTDVSYNKDRTQATVKYVYKVGGYAGSLSRSWYECMFVELDNTVTNVDFVLDNDSAEK